MDKASYFISHVLPDEQTELGKHFRSVHAWDTDKFEEAKRETRVDDIPAIQCCEAVMECRKFQEIPAGNHMTFIGEVISSDIDETRKERALNRKTYFG